MIARGEIADRAKGKRIVGTMSLVVAIGTLAILTQTPQGLSAQAVGSAAIAELAARSPGVRIGGVALKGKGKRARARAPSLAGKPVHRRPAATVMASAAVPEGPIPTSLPLTAFGLPDTMAIPAVPDEPFAEPVSSPGGGFTGGLFPIGGGGVFIGGGGGGPPGGNPPTNEMPGGGTVIPPISPPPPTSAVPEPGAWITLILGFGLAGATMRRRKRAIWA